MTCPRCGAEATAIRQDLQGRVITTGWMCDNDHFLAATEPVDVAG